MDIDKSGSGSGVDNTSMVAVHCARQPTNTPAALPQPPLPLPILPRLPVPGPGSELEIPDFLIGKNNVYGYLSRIKEARFCDLLEKYVMFELANRSLHRGVFSTCDRPKAISWWTARTCTSNLPPFNSLNSFKKHIIKWWTTIQPDWHKIQPRKTLRDTGDWEALYQPGINRLLNIVILAYWWIRILEERGNAINEAYSWFISDVAWVLTQLTGAAHKGIF